MESGIEDSYNDLSADEIETVTLSEVAQSQQSLYADAYAVLGASDAKNCTYSEGYLKRQALYACLTCIPEARTDETKRAGICLACTYHCHDGHDLVELYTKRNFRCDCGNSLFPDFKCNLNNDKDEKNDLNSYNQNFSGVYCICSRPYPDPEDSVVDEMIQCIICEDWYHTRHLGVEIPSSFAEMICENCVKEHDFLLNYEGLTITKISEDINDGLIEVVGDLKESEDNKIVNTVENKSKTDDIIEIDPPGEDGNTDDVIEIDPPNEDSQKRKAEDLVEIDPLSDNCKKSKASDVTEVDKLTEDGKSSTADDVIEIDSPSKDCKSSTADDVIEIDSPSKDCKSSTADDVIEIDAPSEDCKSPEVEDAIEVDPLTDTCKKPKKKTGTMSTKFMKDIAWRQQLCMCENCIEMYGAENVSFLTDIHDTVQSYEDKGKATALEEEEDALNSVDRVPLMEAIAGYHDMKDQLIEYLKKFQENKTIVREEDIREFFSSMAAKKRQRTVLPYFCR